MSKQKKLIGIVEDDTSMLSATEALLDAYGFSTMGFTSAEDFLTLGTSTRFDCLMLDINLGGMSGIELHRHLKGLGCGYPVIFMTAIENESVWQRAIQTGCVACLRKPIPAGKLVEAIAKATLLKQ